MLDAYSNESTFAVAISRRAESKYMKRILGLPVISGICNSVAIFLILGFIGLGCSLAKSANTNATSNSGDTNPGNAAETQPEAASGKSSVDQQIRKIDFKNFTYQPSCTYEDKKSITVKNGEFSSEKQEDGYVDRFYFNITSVTYGDLNGDSSEEAVVLTVCNTGGTGNFSEGFIYTLKGDKPVLFATIPGGDRADGGLRSARVDKGQLVVESNDPGENGGACCPQVVVTTRYEVSSGKLMQIGKEEKRDLFLSQRVSFSKGTSGTTINVKIPAEEGRRFIVGARAGQILDVSVNTDKADIRLLEDAETTQNTNGFSAHLPKNGDYTIEVTNYEGAQLNVVLNIRIR
jgi:hypothetical protein